MAQTSTGLDILLSGVGHESPAPYERQLGLVLRQAEQGLVRFEVVASQGGANVSGAMHGGWISGALDAVSGAAVQSLLAAGENYTTLSLQVNYLRAILPGMKVQVEGKVIRAGGRIITAEARVLGDDGVLAVATASCMRLPAKAL